MEPKTKKSPKFNGYPQGSVNVQNDALAGKIQKEHNKALNADSKFGNFKRKKK